MHRRFVGLTEFGLLLVASQLPAQFPVRQTAPRPLAPAVAPGGLRVTGTPAHATVSWTPAAGASGYTVERWSDLNPACCRTASPVLPATATSWADSNYPLDGSYTFRVTAVHPNGIHGLADVSWVRPAPQDPASATAVQLVGPSVSLTWHPVPGVTRYLVGGPGTTSGVPVAGTTLTVAGVPAGPQTWTVMSLYEPGGVFTKGLSFSAVVRLVPSHAPAWLSRHDAGAQPSMFWASDQLFVCNGSYGGSYSTAGSWNACGASLWHADLFFHGGNSKEMTAPDVKASYGNINDLGVGRFTSCLSKGDRSMCISSSHGAAPGSPGFGDPTSATAASVNWSTPLGYTAIIAEPKGMRFLSFRGDPSHQGAYWETTSTFDSEGPKPTPQACLACHGGRYDPLTQVVSGATMLPIDPSNMGFAPGQRALNEEAIRKLNAVVLKHTPSPAVAAYINGLYNGTPNQAGTAANDEYVPTGWAQQPGFYRAVIKPYCASCHMAATTTVDLSSFGSVQRNKALIYAAVCTQRSMPHAEIPFRRFWTQDTGPVYLPGYFAAMLGYESCP